MHTTTVKPKTTSSRQSKQSGGVAEPARQVAIQPKLTIGQPNDKYEKEADHMADHVTSIPGLFDGNTANQGNGAISNPVSAAPAPISRYVQRKAAPVLPLLQRQEEEKEEPPVQTRLIQRQEGEKEEPSVQSKLIQRQEEKEEAPIQSKFIQRQEDKEEPVAQPKLIRRQEDTSSGTAEMEEPPVQSMLIQRMESEKEELPAQTQLIQRQAEEKEEPSIQSRFIQRMEDKEEPAAQPKLIQRQEDTSAATPEQDDEPVQPKVIQPKSGGNMTAPAGMSKTLQASKGKGSSLPAETKTSMEQGFGANFDNVRIHTDSTAVGMSNSIGAQAFTHGSDIYFNEGRYNPSSNTGRKLIAHELTHTVQQGASKTVQKKPAISRSGPRIQRFVGRMLLKGLNWLAEKIVPGYSLLNVILGKNILTDDPVPRTGENLIKGFMQLIPVVGTILFNELKETNSLAKASIWVEKQVARLGINFDEIASLLEKAWEEMSVWKGISGNIKIFVKYFGPHLKKIMAFLSVMEGKMKELRLEGALLFFGAKEILASLKKNPKAFRRVAENPLVLITDALTGIRMGFDQFKANFGTHFKNAIFEWLFGKFATFNITLPKTFDAKGLFHLVAQLSGLTWPQIRAYVVKKFEPHGDAVMSKIESSVTLVKTFMTEGPIAVWEQAKEYMANIKEMILPPIISFVSGKIVKEAVLMIVSMINPASALVKLALAIYRVVKFFIDRWDQIKSLVSAILSSIRTIALGQLGKAANFIEKVMAKGMSLAIMFLARLLGIDGITKKVQQIIKNFPLFKVRNKVLDIIIRHGKRFLGFLGGKAKGVKQKVKKGVDKGKELVDKGKAKVKAGVKKGKEKVKGGVKKVKDKIFAWWKLRKPFALGNEKHVLRFSGKNRSAALIVNGPPIELKKYIQKLKKNYTSNEAKAILAKVSTDYIQMRKLQKVTSNQSSNSKKIARLYNRILKAFSNQAFSNEWPLGTKNDPIPIKWFKNETDYPLINGKKPSDGISLPKTTKLDKVELKVNSSKFLKEGGILKRVSRNSDPKKAQVGRRLRDQNSGLSVSSGDLFEVDHVQDLTWNGNDNYDNLWPLLPTKNKAANASHNQQVRSIEKGKVTTKSAKNWTSKYFWIAKVFSIPSSSGAHGSSKNRPVNSGLSEIPKKKK